MSSEQVQRLRAERFDVLRQVYEQGAGDTNNAILFRDVLTGYDLDTLEKHVVYLTEKGLLNRVAAGFVAITLYGIEEYEESLAQPDRPTAHFLPLVVAQNYLHVSGDVSGQVQVGTTDSTQSMGVSVDDLRALLAEVRGMLDGLALEPDEKDEIDSDLRTVEVQLESPKPKKGIVREALASARTVVEAVAAREAAAGVTVGAEHLPGLIEKLGHAISLMT
jgi:hypothetical protein